MGIYYQPGQRPPMVVAGGQMMQLIQQPRLVTPLIQQPGYRPAGQVVYQNIGGVVRPVVLAPSMPQVAQPQIIQPGGAGLVAYQTPQGIVYAQAPGAVAMQGGIQPGMVRYAMPQQGHVQVLGQRPQVIQSYQLKPILTRPPTQ